MSTPHVDDRVGGIVCTEIIHKIIGVDIVCELQRDEVLPLVRLIKPINDQDVVMPQFVKTPNDRTADKTCSTRDDHSTFSSRLSVGLLSHAFHFSLLP